MPKLTDQIGVALEVGSKRVFASALDWPGWSRSGRDESSALQALLNYGPRYKKALGSARLGFRPPTEVSQLTVAERLTGGASTDFGALGAAPQVDAQPMDAATLRRLHSILNASWDAFAVVIEAARDRPLRKGPRGGGRDLADVFEHVVEAHYGYLWRINWKGAHNKSDSAAKALDAVRSASAEALKIAATWKTPPVGPRGGARWTARFFVRYATWHILDHVWEIEDRLE
jgi:hypothetical protein